jgi:hypothetical protein
MLKPCKVEDEAGNLLYIVPNKTASIGKARAQSSTITSLSSARRRLQPGLSTITMSLLPVKVSVEDNWRFSLASFLILRAAAPRSYRYLYCDAGHRISQSV